jgi:dihydroflavonol-4-reductase
VRELGRLDRINVEGTRAVLGLATELGVRRVIYVSDLAVSPSLPVNPHATPYVQSKTRAHHEVRQALQDGLPVTSVSFGPVIGPGDVGWLGGLLGRYALRRLPVMFGGETAYSFVTAQEAVENLRQTALSGAAGEAYTLAGPALTLRELFVQAQRATGLPAPYLWLPAALARLWARALRNVRPDLAESAGWLGGQASTPARRESTHQAARLDEALRASVQWHQEQERQRQEAARLVREQANQPEAPA